MSLKRAIRYALGAIGGLAILLLSQSLAAAQCAMCKNAITGSPGAGRLAANFNFAVLVLLIPPVLIFCGIFVAVFRHRNAHGNELSADNTRTNSGQRPLRSAANPTMKPG